MSAAVLVCGNIFDGSSEELTGAMEILVEGNRIASIGRSINRPLGPRLIDLSERTGANQRTPICRRNPTWS